VLGRQNHSAHSSQLVGESGLKSDKGTSEDDDEDVDDEDDDEDVDDEDDDEMKAPVRMMMRM
jgi:hypothetical protein